MTNNLPDLDSLRCFVAAAELLRFRAAARRVGLSPAAFSERLRRLEEVIGAKLFDRTTRTVALTTAGQRMLPFARDLLLRAASCGSVAHGEGAPMPFALTIGSRYELALSWLCPALVNMSAARPERTLHICLGDSPDLLARLRAGDIDAAVLSTRLVEPGLEECALHKERYVFVGAPESQRKVLVDVSPDLPLFRYLLEALNHQRVTGAKGSVKSEGVESEPLSFDRYMYMGGIGVIRHRVLAGAGVAVLPEYFVRKDLDEKRLLRLLPDLELQADTFRLIWRKGNPMKAELLELAQTLRALPLQ